MTPGSIFNPGQNSSLHVGGRSDMQGTSWLNTINRHLKFEISIFYTFWENSKTGKVLNISAPEVTTKNV